MNTKNLLYFLLGFGLGGGLLWYITREKYEEESKTAIEEVKKYYKKLDEERTSKEETVTIKAENVGAGVQSPYEVVSSIYSANGLKNFVEKPVDYSDIPAGLEDDLEDDEDFDEDTEILTLHPEEVQSHPYVIDESAFVNEKSHYDKVGLFYYKKDDIIVDENYEPVQDWQRLIGPDIGARFKLQDRTDDPIDFIYIRNDQIGCDYEVGIRYESFY